MSDPQKLGRFEIRERLGTGGFGAVYRAYDPQLQRDVALKLLQLTGDEKRDQQRIDRFLVEGRAAASLQHPHIVPVFDAGRDEKTGEYYMAAAFINGQTLSAEIDGRPLEVERAATITRKLASALDYAHQQGILHRDVKPDNVMLDARDEPHLMDFGLARLENSDEKLTRDGSVMGTPAYMSPEQCQGQQEELGPASDQYSLGCVLYELLTGETPFTGPPSIQLHNHLRTEPEPPNRKNNEIPKDLETICLKALSKAPQERYGSCAELGDDLRRWQANEPIHARSLNRFQKFVRWCRREPVVAALTLAVFLVFSAGLVVSTWQWRRAASAAITEAEARAELEVQRQQLINANDDLSRAEQRARDALEQAKRRRDEALVRAYSARFALLDRAFDEGNTVPLSGQLSLMNEADPEAEVRGWEWYYLASLQSRIIQEFPVGAWAIAASPDGKYLAALGGHSEFYVWRTTDWQRIAAFEHVQYQGSSDSRPLAWSPDGRFLAAGNAPSIVDVANGESVVDLSDAHDMILSISWHPNGTALVATHKDGRFNVWKSHEWTLQQTVSENMHPAYSTAWSPDGNTLLTVHGYDSDGVSGGAFLWPVSRNRIANPQHFEGNWRSCAWSHTTGLIALSTQGSSWPGIYDPATLEAQRILPHSRGGVYEVAWADDSPRLVTRSVGGDVHVWDEQFRVDSYTRIDDDVHAVTIHPAAKWLAIAGFDRVVIMNLVGGCESCLLFGAAGDHTRSSQSQCFAFSHDGTRIAVGGFNQDVTIWDTDSGDIFAELPVSHRVCSIAFSPDSRRVAVGSPSGQLSILSISGQQDPRTFTFVEGAISQLEWRAGDSLIANGAGKLVQIDVDRGRMIPAGFSTDFSVKLFRFSPDGTRAVVGDREHALHLLTFSGNSSVRQVAQFSDEVVDIAWYADGPYCAIALKHQPAELWDVDEGKRLGILQGFGAVATSLAWNPLDQRIATSPSRERLSEYEQSEYGVTIWHFRTRESVMSLYCAHEEMSALHWDPRGHCLAGLDAQGRVWLWNGHRAYELESKDEATTQPGY